MPRGTAAFPNAYISTDEPPRRSVSMTVLCALAAIGPGYLGAVILLLSLFSTEYSSVTQVASDYGVGAFAPEMNSGFFFAGVGVVSLAVVAWASSGKRSGKGGSLLLVSSGLALVVNAFYQTDIEGAATTMHGVVHGVAGAVFFFTAPVALLLITHGLGRRRFVLTAAALLLAAASLALGAAFGLDAAGLEERILILVVFSSFILTAARLLKGA